MIALDLPYIKLLYNDYVIFIWLVGEIWCNPYLCIIVKDLSDMRLYNIAH